MVCQCAFPKQALAEFVFLDYGDFVIISLISQSGNERAAKGRRIICLEVVQHKLNFSCAATMKAKPDSNAQGKAVQQSLGQAGQKAVQQSCG
jgi:hypothetical protein